MVCVYEYENYRDYLQAYYEQKKSLKGAAYSYRSFSRLAGFKSPNLLQLVIQGKRNLTQDSIDRFNKALRHDPEEAGFFNDLVNLNQAKTDEDRSEFSLRIDKAKRYRCIKELEQDQLEYATHWYYSAIRELVLIPNFKNDPVWIAKTLQPNITQEQAQAAVDTLLRLGLLKVTDGELVQSEPHVSTAQEIKSDIVKKFHWQMIERGAASLYNTRGKHREVSSLTVAVSKETFQEVKQRIQNFRREINILLEREENPDAVYQINFQMFNLSEVNWSKS